MEKNNKIPFKINNNNHLKNILDNNFYLELGVVDTNVIRRLLNNEVINIDEVTYYPIQNKGLGNSSSVNETIKNNLPFYFYRKLMENNPLISLVLTYGLYFYRDYEKKDKFAPIIFIPITMFFEYQNTYIKMISRPFENPALYTIIQNSNKLQFLQNETYTDIYSLDRTIHNLEKTFPNSVRIDNYLTFVEMKKSEIILPNKKQMKSIFNVERKINKERLYLSPYLTNKQKEIIVKAVSGNSVVISGAQGTGKTTTLMNIIVNLLYHKKKVIYVSDSYESINQVHNFLKKLHLNKAVINLCEITNKDDLEKEVAPEFKKITNGDQIKAIMKEKKIYTTDFEKSMNCITFDYKFLDVLKRFFLIESFDEIKELELSIDDKLFDLHKKRFKTIYNALVALEYNHNKLGSIKESLWSNIPYDRDIVHINGIINVLFKLNESFKTLRELELELENYGLKIITSFSSMKRCLEPLKDIDITRYPEKWLSDLSVYFEAKRKFSEMEREIENYNRDVESIDNKYINLKSIDIEKEISTFYGKFFKEGQEENVETIIFYRSEIDDIVASTIYELNKFEECTKSLTQMIDLDYMLKGEQIDDVYRLIDIYLNNNICGKMLTFFINNKNESYKQRILVLSETINSINVDIEKYEQMLSSRKFYKNANNKLQINTNLGALVKKKNKLEKEYHELTEDSYSNHDAVMKAVEELEVYYESLKSKNYRKKIYDFILSFSKNNHKQIYELFNNIVEMKKALDSRCEYFENFSFKYDGLSLLDKYNLLKEFCDYIKELYLSQDRLYAVIINKEVDEVHAYEYYEIQNALEENKNLMMALRTNNIYKRLFDFLYEGEKTNCAEIKKLMQVFDLYLEDFNDNNKAKNSFAKITELKELAYKISDLISEMGGILNLYGKYFDDGTSRYYYSSIEKNISALSNLLEAKEELGYYLNITQQLRVLDKYELKNLIKYILTTEDTYKISSRLAYIYYKYIIDKTISERVVLNDSNTYVKVLNDIVNLDDMLREKISRDILEKTYYQAPKASVFTHHQNDNICRASIILSTNKYANEYLHKNQFDVMILDEAHMMTSGNMIDIFKSKQLIVAGDYQSNNIVNENLISLIGSYESVLFRKRFVQGPRKITYSLHFADCPYKNTLKDNIGVRVINNKLEEHIFSIYLKNKDSKFNIFIKDIALQREYYENLSKVFLQYGIPEVEIINFLNNNINIVDLGANNYIHSDYNVLVLSEYCEENSQIVSQNNIEILTLPTKQLIIFDDKNYLHNENDSYFTKMIKDIVNNKNIFNERENDAMTNLIAQMLKDLGYEVFFPWNGFNLAVKKKNSDELVTIMILFSNGNVYDVYSNIRDIRETYINAGHKFIIKTMLDLIDGPKKFVRKLCEEIDG